MFHHTKPNIVPKTVLKSVNCASFGTQPFVNQQFTDPFDLAKTLKLLLNHLFRCCDMWGLEIKWVVISHVDKFPSCI